MEFIGKKFNLKKSSRVLDGRFIGSMELVSYELDDDEMESNLLNTFGNNIRIITPSTMVTPNHQPDRTNIHIDINGVIKEISNG